MVRGAPLPLAAIFTFVGHGTTKKSACKTRQEERLKNLAACSAGSAIKKVCNKGCRLLSHGVIGALVV